MPESWRVSMICTIKPIADTLAGALRELGHEPVSLLAPRRPEGEPQPEFLQLTASSAPPGVDLLFAKDKWSMERLLRAYEPDLTVCWGFPWKIPREALDVAWLGSINGHPALLPRHRGPIPFAWTLRTGDTDWGFTWHRMDAELDTGNILAQGSDPIRDDDCDIGEFGPRLLAAAAGLLPRALDRIAAGDPGDPQPAEGATWAGHFEDDDYVRVDWSQPAHLIHNQVRAWHLTFGLSACAPRSQGSTASRSSSCRRGSRIPAAARAASSAATGRFGSSRPSPSSPIVLENDRKSSRDRARTPYRGRGGASSSSRSPPACSSPPPQAGAGRHRPSSRSRGPATSGRSAPTAHAHDLSSVTRMHPPGRPTARGSRSSRAARATRSSTSPAPTARG